MTFTIRHGARTVKVSMKLSARDRRYAHGGMPKDIPGLEGVLEERIAKAVFAVLKNASRSLEGKNK